jgi:hypothetical protein
MSDIYLLGGMGIALLLLFVLLLFAGIRRKNVNLVIGAVAACMLGLGCMAVTVFLAFYSGDVAIKIERAK